MTPEELNKVMLVDDNLTDRFIHKKLLAIYGMGREVLEFSSGKSALEYLKKEKGSEENLPDLILLDVLMPEMSGFDFLVHLETIESQLVKVPMVFMLSSTDDESDLREARNIKLVQKMLRKPFSPEALVKALSEL